MTNDRLGRQTPERAGVEIILKKKNHALALGCRKGKAVERGLSSSLNEAVPNLCSRRFCQQPRKAPLEPPVLI